MGIFDKLFHRTPKGSKWAPTLSGYMPLFSYYGDNIYASDVVQQALKCIVDEISKTVPTHIRKKGSDETPVADTLQTVLNNPNPLMTTSEMIEKTCWLLLLNFNAFIVPTYYSWLDSEGTEHRQYKALWPIQPTQVDFIEDASGRIYVHFMFATGWDTTIPYDDVIHIKYNYALNEYMGGDRMGQPNNNAILKTLELNADLLNGVAKAMKASYAVNGTVKYNTMLDDGTMERNIRELEKKLENSQSGFLPMDLKYDFTPFPRNTQLVDESTLKFVDEKILRNWGVPLPILVGDFTKAQYEAFYQKGLEKLILNISQAFTKKLFTERERAFGNEVKFYPKELIFMTTDQKISIVNLLSPTGGLYENEKRVIFGFTPLPELEGVRYMSLNWVDVDIAQQYQLSKAKAGDMDVEVIDEEREEI